MHFRNTLLATCAFASLGSVTAFAQTAPASDPAALTEVVVTANKRAENQQDVAAAVTSVGFDQLQRSGVKEITDISKVIPEVQVNTGQLTNVTIRGIRTGATGPTTDSPNAVHIDGAYVSRFTSLQGLFFDVQRIEVLAGPQGTLYGRNAAGGTMNIITNRPSQTFGGNASVEVGNYDTLNIQAAINLPIGDTMAVRAAYFRNRRDGFIDNGTDDADQEAARIAFRWAPNDNTSLLLTADSQKVRGRNGVSGYITEVLKQPTILTAPTGIVSLVAAGTPGGVIVPIKTANDRFALSAIYGNQDLNQQNTDGGGVMGQFDHDFGWANMTFQASYRTSFSHNTTGTITGFSQDPRLITASVIRPGGPTRLDANAKWNSQELRFTSPADQQVTWVAGVYRFYENSYDNHNITFRVTYPNTGAATVGQIVRTDPLVVDRDTVNDISTDNAYAAFGQATWTPTGLPALHLTAGGRYNYEKKHATGLSINGGVKLLVPTLTGVIDSAFDLRDSWEKVTYKLNASYDITPQNMIYVDHSTGFKSGGFGFGANPAYEPETIKAWEIGTKNRFLDNRLQVNASAWKYDYKNFVANVPDYVVDSTTGRFISLLNTSNAGGADIKGQSISIDWLATRNDTLTFNLTHIDGKYSDFDVSNRYRAVLATPGAGLLGATLPMYNYSGEVIGNVPDYAATGTYSHVFRLPTGSLDAQVLVRYAGERLLNNQASSLNVNGYIVGKAYTIGDFTLRYKHDDANWNITAYVRNLTNKDVLTGAGYSANEPFLPVNDPRVTFAYRTETYAPPRTFGVIFSALF